LLNILFYEHFNHAINERKANITFRRFKKQLDITNFNHLIMKRHKIDILGAVFIALRQL